MDISLWAFIRIFHLGLLVITDLRLPWVQGQLLQSLYGHLSALLPWFVVSWTALLPPLADPRIKSCAHKCQMIDLRTACIFSPTSAEMLIMLIYYYWFQFPRLYLLEAVPLKLQPHRIWIKIPGITNAFQLCLAEQWLLNEQHSMCECKWTQSNACFLFGPFESRSQAIGWFCVSSQPIGLKRGWFWITHCHSGVCGTLSRYSIALAPKGIWKAPVS